MYPAITRANVPFFAAVLCLFGVSCCSAVDDKLPERLDGVSIDEMLDAELPLDVKFMDDRGAEVTFGDLLRDGKPLILTLNYSDCPGLCVAQLNGLVKGINDVGSIHLGDDFRMVSLSINPKESRERAAGTKAKYAESLADHHKPQAWSFLVGTEANIQKIANTVGFRYTYDAKHQRYNHAAAAIFVSPKGHVTRYLYEVGFTGETLKMALVEAGQGKIGSSLDAFVLWCYHYDANENRYSTNAKTVLSFTAGLFVTIGLIASLPFWLSKKRGGGSVPHVPQA
jgi:protein SCO1/2